jgi:hypothetical protein
MKLLIQYTPLTWEECQVKTRLLPSGKYNTRIQHPTVKMLSASFNYENNFNQEPIEKMKESHMDASGMWKVKQQLLLRINKKLSILQQLTERRIQSVTYTTA